MIKGGGKLANPRIAFAYPGRRLYKMSNKVGSRKAPAR
jgi:hypothetical protein